MITDEREFQSTHPLRGATRHQRSDHRQRPISIHAPLAGCDVIGIVTIGQPGDFNPRTPCGVRPQHQTRNPIVLYFNPRTPCGVRPGQAAVNGTQELISIHAPLAGCDRGLRAARDAYRHFNPRTPCGVRHVRYIPPHTRCTFQSTHPLRGATRWPCGACCTMAISIHAPLAGCDIIRERFFKELCISIHAPLAGCD